MALIVTCSLLSPYVECSGDPTSTPTRDRECPNIHLHLLPIAVYVGSHLCQI